MSHKFYIYEHIRPDTGAVFYVGKGHGRRKGITQNRSNYWQRVVAKAGGFSVRMVAENIDEELAFLIEVERIDQLRFLGVKLCNLTDGGEGTSGCIPSEDTRRKISEANIGRRWSVESRQKASERHKGKTLSDGTRRKMSEAMMGCKHPISPEARHRLVERNKNYTWSEEAREKIAAANKNRVWSEEARQKLSLKSKKRPQSEETRKKRSDAMKATLARKKNDSQQIF